MPKFDGVYKDAKGRWYFKVWLGRDPISDRQAQITKRGFVTAADAARARRELLDDVDDGRRTVRAPASLTVNDLLDIYLDGLDADGRLSAKTRFDYRVNANAYVRPWLGKKRVRDLTPETILAWQRQLMRRRRREGRQAAVGEHGAPRPLTAGGRAEARGRSGGASIEPVGLGPPASDRPQFPGTGRPNRPGRSSGARRATGCTRSGRSCSAPGSASANWSGCAGTTSTCSRQHARVVEFASTLGWDLVESHGKSATAIRTIDLDVGLVAVLERQRDMQRFEARRSDYEATDFVFTKPAGGHYHPQVISKTLARVSEQAGLPRLTAHGLRHTSATLMLDSGVPPKVAAERLGHADPTLFTNLYSHVTPTMQREAADRLGHALFGDA